MPKDGKMLPKIYGIAFDQQNDQRLDVTLKRSFTYSDGSIKDFDKPYVFKYWDSQAEPKGNNTEAIFPAIRTAEMYLIIAEALNEINQGANEEAVIAINAVRNRAGLTTAVPLLTIRDLRRPY